MVAQCIDGGAEPVAPHRRAQTNATDTVLDRKIAGTPKMSDSRAYVTRESLVVHG
jgi:hypothetical protein